MKQNKTICLDQEAIKTGNDVWKEKGFKSFSDYVNHLILKDNGKL